jgi:hypothetical protein
VRITFDIDERLLKQAAQLTGIKDPVALLHAGLEALINREIARRLAALGGTQPGIRSVPRRRPRRHQPDLG